MDIHRHFWNMHYHQLRPKSILLYQTCMQGEMNYWNNKHYITVCFDKLEPYKCHLKKLRDIIYTLDYKPNSTAAFKLFSFDVPEVPPLKTRQVYNMMQLLFSSTPAIRVEELMFMDRFFSFF